MDNQDQPQFIKPYMEEFVEKYELKRIHIDFLERLLLFLVAGFGLIAALAWDDAFKDIFQKYFGGFGSLSQKIIYAGALTIIVAIFTIIVSKIIKKKKRKLSKSK